MLAKSTSTVASNPKDTEMTTIKGTEKSDLLYDGPDATTIKSKGGFDVFIFNDLAADTIRDFNAVKDTIVVNHFAFAPVVGSFVTDRGETLPVYAPKPDDWSLVYGGRNAADDPGFAYHKASGRLWYDADGEGGQDAVLIANLGERLKLTDDNLVVG